MGCNNTTASVGSIPYSSIYDDHKLILLSGAMECNLFEWHKIYTGLKLLGEEA